MEDEGLNTHLWAGNHLRRHEIDDKPSAMLRLLRRATKLFFLEHQESARMKLRGGKLLILEQVVR